MKTKLFIFTFIIFLFSNLINAAPPTNTWSVLDAPLTEGQLPMTASGTLIWGDYNNDGHLDAFIIAGQGTPVVGLYKNNGDETFTPIATNITALNQGAAVFLDYNNDGNLDLLIAGKTDAPQTILYKNTGAPNYTFEVDNENTEILVNVFPEGNDNSPRILEAFDFDNDGWTDILINGNHGATWDANGSQRVVALYKNNKGTFELQSTPYDGGHFTPMNGGSIHVGDVNNDGFDDILVTGYSSGAVTNLYINKQDGTFMLFTPTEDAKFTGHLQGETVFVDINSDGWNDIVEIGRDANNGWANFANIFINNKDNTCTKVPSSYSNLAGGQARIAAGDVNNDGSMD
ncbi:MAG TPA: VCBS repeat-containing protein, partial [Bacteroidales bacterium]|nr:VCBS repeat-containing protein [Bacteroidales bacterium]